MQTDDPNSRLLYAKFSDHGDRLFIGTREGLRIYALDEDRVSLKYKIERSEGDDNPRIEGGCSIVEAEQSLIMAVGNDDCRSNSSRKLRIYSGKEGVLKYEKTFPTPILAVRIVKGYYCVCLETQIYVFDKNRKLVKTIQTSPNPYGIIAMRDYFLAYIVDNEIRIVEMSDDFQIRKTLKIPYKVTITSLVFNEEISMLAFMESGGKKIGVYRLLTHQEVPDLYKRGQYQKVSFLPSFSPCKRFISMSSPSTAHIFALKQDLEEQSYNSTVGWLSSALISFKPLITTGEKPIGQIALKQKKSMISFMPSRSDRYIHVAIIDADYQLLLCKMKAEMTSVTEVSSKTVNIFDKRYELKERKP